MRLLPAVHGGDRPDLGRHLSGNDFREGEDFTALDEHGWIAPVLQADVWVPRAFVFSRMAMVTEASPSEEQRRDPCHLLARWRAIEAAVGRVIAAKNLKAW